MEYLLDTHTLIWFINGDKELSFVARKAIESDSAVNYVSIASLWEMAIKISLNRLELNAPFETVAALIVENNFHLLQISFEDVSTLSALPFHHRDPFDRLIISQSITNDLTLISKDAAFKEYEIKQIW